MVKHTQCEATQGVWGIRSLAPHRGCREATGGWMKRREGTAKARSAGADSA